MKYQLYTDGSALGQDSKFKTLDPVIGGYAWALYNDTEMVSYGSGSEENTTNNRMEMLAVISGLRAFYSAHKDEEYELTIYTDSQYVKDCWNEYLPEWKRNGWRKKKGTIANLDLWKILDKSSSFVKFDIRWVKAHDVDERNNFVDGLAGDAAVNKSGYIK